MDKSKLEEEEIDVHSPIHVQENCPLLTIFDAYAEKASDNKLDNFVYISHLFPKLFYKLKKCGVYVRRSEDQATTSETKCFYCSLTKEKHAGRDQGKELKRTDRDCHKEWLEKTTRRRELTTVDVEIHFSNQVSRIRKKANFIRFADIKLEDDMQCRCMKKLLLDVWQLPKPKLVISVTGGARDFRFDSHVKKAFSEGLVKMANTNGAWVITGGKYRGVMKLVSRAMQNRVAEDKEKLRRLPCIGICTWGRVSERDSLLQGDYRYDPSEIEASSKTEKGTTALDPNHTHFLMVDDGTEHRERTHQPWHGKFHRFIEKGDGDGPVPVVTVLVNGGTGSLDTVKETLKHGLPVVVVKGSGRAADVLAFAFETASREPKPEGKKYTITWSNADTEELTRQVKDEFSDLSRTDPWPEFKWGEVARKREVVKTCVRIGLEDKEKPLLAIFDALDESVSPALRQLDYVALMLVFRSIHKSDCQRGGWSGTGVAVKLAMNWNRADIMRDELLSLAIRVNQLKNEWPKLMDDALRMSDRHEFVRSFIEEGVVNCRKYLQDDPQKLESLYNQTPEHYHGESNLAIVRSRIKPNVDATSKFTTEQIDSIVAILIEGDLHPTDPDENAFMVLFLWALLTERWKLAEVFWSFCPEPGTGALAAAVILNSVLRYLRGYTLRWKSIESLSNQIRLWNRRAVDIFSLYHKQQPKLALTLLRNVSNHWGRKEPLELALQSKNTELFAQDLVQYHVIKLWMGKLKATSSKVKVGAAMILFPVGPLFLDIEEDRIEDDRPKESGFETYSRKFQALVTSTMFQCWLYFIFYLAFLGFFSYSLLVRWDPNPPTAVDVMTIIWVASLVIEDLLQVCIVKPKLLCMLWTRPKLAMKMVWFSLPRPFPVIKLVAFVLFVSGVIVRFCLPGGDDEMYPTNVVRGRRLLSLAICLFFIRGMEFFIIFESLGVRLTMIYKMIKDVATFLVILLTCLVTYGIAVQALLLPLQDPSWQILWNVVYMPYWQIYAFLFLDYFTGGVDEMTCNASTAAVGVIGTETEVCVRYEPLAFILLAVYLILTIVLLLNLLIAILNHTFERVEAEADTLWKYRIYVLIASFRNLARFPTPINVLVSVYKLWRKYKEKQPQPDDDQRPKDNPDLLRLEELCVDLYLSRSGSND